mgnify:CR=1 FL=1
MILDHIAYRTKDRFKTAQFFITNFDYRLATEFEIDFEENGKVECLVLKPTQAFCEGTQRFFEGIPSVWTGMYGAVYQKSPEIFISDSQDPNTPVGKWVKERGGIGGVHHLAYSVEDIELQKKEMESRGIEFSSEIIDCPEDGLRQVFTKPLEVLGGVIVELIERSKEGFCKNSVKKLMEVSCQKEKF